MAKITLNDIVSQYGNVSLYNTNNTTLEDALNNGVLWRNNPVNESNQMGNDLDMNSYKIINGGDAVGSSDYVTYSQLIQIVSSEEITVNPFYGSPITTITGTTLTLNSLHAGRYLRFTNAAGCVVTVPPDVFNVADEIHFRSATDGSITFVEGSGVSIDIAAVYDSSPELYSNSASATIKLVGTNTWDIFGLLKLA